MEGIDDLKIDSEIRPDNAIESIKRMKILKNEKPKKDNLKNNNQVEKVAEISFAMKEKLKKPKNEIKSNDISLFIPSKNKESLLKINNGEFFIEGNKKMLLLVRKFDAENFAEDKPYDINIEVIKSPQTENKIEEKDRIFLPPKKKEILLLKVNNDELSIGVDQASLKNKNIGNLVENKENNIYIEGKKIDNIGIIRRGIIF